MSDALYRLVYISRNAIDGSGETLRAEIEQILVASRRNNGAAAISGALMFNAGGFAQVLEGPRRAIETTFERIQCDTRHRHVVVLDFTALERRLFARWTMAYVGTDTRAARQFAALPQITGGAVEDHAQPCDGERIYTLLQEHLLEAQYA